MFTFFRKIRQTYLSEGKTIKYLKYALGEIVLVVIGILIALQINTWKAEQELKKQETIYLSNLRDDLSLQIKLFDKHIHFENIIIQQCKDITKHYEVNKGFYQMDSIYSKLTDLTVRTTFSNSNTTLMEMINSGQINLISNEALKKKLVVFNQTLTAFANITQNNNSNIVDELVVPIITKVGLIPNHSYSEPMRNYFIKMGFDNYLELNDPSLSKISERLLNEEPNRLELLNKIIIRNSLAGLQLVRNEELKKEAEQLLMDIEKELG